MTVQSHFVVRAPELQARSDAASIITAAQREADAIKLAASAERASECQRGFAEGRAEGLADGIRAGARLASEAAEAAARFLATREDELVELAFAVAGRILSGLPREATLVAVAREAIAAHRTEARLVLRVDATLAPALRAALATDRVEVQADPGAPAGACTLAHSRGAVALGLSDQLEVLRASAGCNPSAGGNR